MTNNFLAYVLIFIVIKSFVDGSVIHLNWTNFDEQVLNSNDYWFIKCYERENLPENMLINEFEKVGLALNGLVKVGDAFNPQPFLSKFGIFHHQRPDPIIIFFDADKTKYDKYYGSKSPKHMVKYVLDSIRKRVNVIIFNEPPNLTSIDLTGDKYFEILDSSEPWIIALIFPHETTSTTLMDWWEEIAIPLNGKARIGHYDLTVDLKNNRFMHRLHNLNKLTIICFPKGSKREDTVQFYHGSIVFDYVLHWALDVIIESNVQHLINQRMYKEYCHGKICVIYFLPKLIDCPIKCRHNYLDKINKLANNAGYIDWNWLWVEKDEQKELEVDLGVREKWVVIVDNFKQSFSRFDDILLLEKEIHMNASIFKEELRIKSVDKWLPIHDEL